MPQLTHTISYVHLMTPLTWHKSIKVAKSRVGGMVTEKLLSFS